jgi:TPR repeat protein
MTPTLRRLTHALALAGMVSAGITISTYGVPAVAQSAVNDPAALKAAITAAQILYDTREYLPVRDLLRSYLADDKAAILYIRSGIALKQSTEVDFALAGRLTDDGSVAGARLKGDMLLNGLGVAADLAAAEAAYRYAIEMGDPVSIRRLADLLTREKRYIEAIPLYAELKENPADEVKFITLSVTQGGITDPVAIGALLERLDAMSQSEVAAARAAANIYENGHGVPQNSGIAITYARRAVALGDTRLGDMAAQDCDTCSALELVGTLKATANLGDATRTGIALERPLARGLYADAWAVISRFPAEQRVELVRHLIDRFGAISNPVVGLTQAYLQSHSGYDGELDGMLTSTTLAAVHRFGAARNIELVRFDDTLVATLLASAE